MSRSWGSRTVVFVGAEAVQIATAGGGFGGRKPVIERAGVAPGTNTAHTVADALRTALGAPRSKRGDAIVVLSNHYVRYALVPDAGKLRNDAERQVAARHTLQAVYGEAAADWRVAVDTAGGKGAAVAAGIDAALADAVVATLAAANLQARALKPLFACALNAARRTLGNGPAWFGVAEPGRLALAYVEGGAFKSLRSHRLRRALGDELPVLLEQDRLTGLVRGGSESNGRVVLAGSDLPEVALPGGAWSVQAVAVDPMAAA